MSNHKNHITKLYFWAWYLNFVKLTDQSHLFKEALLADKLYQYLFFYKVEADVSPSYNFWSLVSMFVGNFYASPNTEAHASYEKKFLKNEEKFLKEKVYHYITYWRYFPQILRDFWIFYPKYAVPFDNVECIYLDIWSDLPKVIDSLLSELLVRDAPLREKIPADSFEVAISNIAATIMTTDILPAVPEECFTEEELSNHIVEYLSGEDGDSVQVFLQVISFYLNSRPLIKGECSSILKAKGLPVTDTSLMRNFLGEYIFKGVSKETKRFFVANCNLKEKNPCKTDRARQLTIWNSYSEKEHEKIITRAKESVKYMAEYLAAENALTLEEKAERHKQAIAEAEDFESLPKVSLSGLMALGGDSSERK